MSENPKKPPTPRHLGKRGATWWRFMIKEHTLEPSEYQTLTLAAECLDRGEQARRMLDREGLTVPTEHGTKTHPAIAIEARMKLVFVRLVRTLNIDNGEDEKKPLTEPAEYQS